MKILNRLEDEGLLETVTKGVYYIGTKRLTGDFLLSQYIGNGKGMVIGYEMFNSIGLSAYQDDKVEAYPTLLLLSKRRYGN